MEMAGDYPDVLVGCTGGGSNFAGMCFPFIGQKFRCEAKKPFRVVAVEPAACPSLTKGTYAYDFGDTGNMTPLMKSHTLGHPFVPPPDHAGGLRYHAMAPLIRSLSHCLRSPNDLITCSCCSLHSCFIFSACPIPSPFSPPLPSSSRKKYQVTLSDLALVNSHLKEIGELEAVAYKQTECFEAGVLFAKAEGILPAPEANHAVKGAIAEAMRCKAESKSEVILFNLCGHGNFDMAAYDKYNQGGMVDSDFNDSEVAMALACIPKVPDN